MPAKRTLVYEFEEENLDKLRAEMRGLADDAQDVADETEEVGDEMEESVDRGTMEAKKLQNALDRVDTDSLRQELRQAKRAFPGVAKSANLAGDSIDDSMEEAGDEVANTTRKVQSLRSALEGTEGSYLINLRESGVGSTASGAATSDDDDIDERRVPRHILGLEQIGDLFRVVKIFKKFPKVASTLLAAMTGLAAAIGSAIAVFVGTAGLVAAATALAATFRDVAGTEISKQFDKLERDVRELGALFVESFSPLISNLVIPALRDMVANLKKQIPHFRDMAETWLPSIIDTFKGLITHADEIIDTMEVLTAALDMLWETFEGATQAVLALVSGPFALLEAAVTQLADNLLMFGAYISDLANLGAGESLRNMANRVDDFRPLQRFTQFNIEGMAESGRSKVSSFKLIAERLFSEDTPGPTSTDQTLGSMKSEDRSEFEKELEGLKQLAEESGDGVEKAEALEEQYELVKKRLKELAKTKGVDSSRFKEVKKILADVKERAEKAGVALEEPDLSAYQKSLRDLKDNLSDISQKPLLGEENKSKRKVDAIVKGIRRIQDESDRLVEEKALRKFVDQLGVSGDVKEKVFEELKGEELDPVIKQTKKLRETLKSLNNRPQLSDPEKESRKIQAIIGTVNQLQQEMKLLSEESLKSFLEGLGLSDKLLEKILNKLARIGDPVAEASHKLREDLDAINKDGFLDEGEKSVQKIERITSAIEDLRGQGKLRTPQAVKDFLDGLNVSGATKGRVMDNIVGEGTFTALQRLKDEIEIIKNKGVIPDTTRKKQKLDAIVKTVKDLREEGKLASKEALKGFLKDLEISDKLMKRIINKLETAANTQAATPFQDFAVSSFRSFTDDIGNLFGDALFPDREQLKRLRSRRRDIQESLRQAREGGNFERVRELRDRLKEVNNQLQKQSTLMGRVKNAFNNFARVALQALERVLSKLISTAIFAAVISAFTGGAGTGFGATFTAALGGGQIPGLAEGGVVNKPTLAMVGENRGNESEIVSPESKMKSIFSETMQSAALGGGNITVQVQGESFVEGRAIKTSYDGQTKVERRKGRIK